MSGPLRRLNPYASSLRYLEAFAARRTDAEIMVCTEQALHSRRQQSDSEIRRSSNMKRTSVKTKEGAHSEGR